MRIKNDAEMPYAPVEMEGAQDVAMKVLLGPDDASEKIIMRLFRVAPGGHTPCHRHPYEHLVRVMSGRGQAVDEAGAQHDLVSGQSVFVAPDELHQFLNPFSESFEFTCTIPNPER